MVEYDLNGNPIVKAVAKKPSRPFIPPDPDPDAPREANGYLELDPDALVAFYTAGNQVQVVVGNDGVPADAKILKMEFISRSGTRLKGGTAREGHLLRIYFRSESMATLRPGWFMRQRPVWNIDTGVN